MKCFYGLIVLLEAFVMILVGIIMISSADEAMVGVSTFWLVSLALMFIFFRGDLKRYKKAMRGEPLNSFASQLDEFLKNLEEKKEK